MLPILNQILLRVDADESLAVCTVVRTRGSTPQKAGAVMVVLQDGRTLGTIGGGCVEAEVRTRALRRLSEPGIQLLNFKLDDDHGWDDGLVCGGTMDVAVQVIASPSSPDALSLRAARDQLVAGEITTLTIQAGEEQFSRDIEPVPLLLIAGAGHVGSSLAAVARQMGFDVTVVDDRPDYAAPERFPGGVECRVGEIASELAKFPINRSTYVVVVTRGHRNDGRALAAVIQSPAKYLGLIGSKRKILAIFSDLLQQGIPRERLAQVHAPIGLDIGGVTPGEIAVSIAAELVAVRRGIAAPFGVMRLTGDQINHLGP